MGTRFKKVRFYLDNCPQSLVERIYFKMSGVNTIHTNAKHFKDRVVERKIPEYVLNRINSFDIKDWKLVTCEVRADTGKFVNSTWEILHNDNRYWLTIGFGNVAETIVSKNIETKNIKRNIIIDREMFGFVETVNRKLMEEEGEEMAERLSYQEIKERYPNQWVGLIDVEFENDNVTVKSAVITVTGKTAEELGIMTLNKEIQMPYYTTPDNVFQMGAVSW